MIQRYHLIILYGIGIRFELSACLICRSAFMFNTLQYSFFHSFGEILLTLQSSWTWF